MRQFRNACKVNPYTRWLQPKQLLAKDARYLSLPLSWTVSLAERGIVSITPGEIIGFEVQVSVRRILLLCVDYAAAGEPRAKKRRKSDLSAFRRMARARSALPGATENNRYAELGITVTSTPDSASPTEALLRSFLFSLRQTKRYAPTTVCCKNRPHEALALPDSWRLS